MGEIAGRECLIEEVGSPNLGHNWQRLSVGSNVIAVFITSRKCTHSIHAFQRCVRGAHTLIFRGWDEVAVAIIGAKLFSCHLLRRRKNWGTYVRCGVKTTTSHKVNPLFESLHKFNICMRDWICQNTCNEGGDLEKYENVHDELNGDKFDYRFRKDKLVK